MKECRMLLIAAVLYLSDIYVLITVGIVYEHAII